MSDKSSIRLDVIQIIITLAEWYLWTSPQHEAEHWAEAIYVQYLRPG